MTDWICICAEGETGDRRYIERDWLIDAADLYNPKLKNAMIFRSHFRQREEEADNYGEVLALKCEESQDDGLMRLYARLRPNIKLMLANAEDQLFFCSAEFTPDGNFRGTGKTYLEGLVVTDEPASVYVDRLNFSRSQHRGARFAATQPFTIKEHVMSKQKNGWRKCFGIMEQAPAETPAEPDKLQALAEAVAALENRVAALEGQAEQTETSVEEVKQDVAEVQEDVETVKEVVDTKEFKLLRDNIGGIVKSFSKLDSRITTLPNKNPGTGRKPFNFL